MNDELVNKNKSYRGLLPNPYFLLPILVLLVATFLRLYLVPVLPPGLNFDEAGNGVAAFDILRGEPQLWWRIGGGKEPLWPYLIALSTMVLGNIPLALRLPAVLVGILTVAAVYPLGISLFRGKSWQSHLEARLVALFTMLGLALSAWHLHFSRLGFRAILFPLLATLGFYFFWRGIKCQGTGVKSQVWAALFLGLAVYAYLAARLLILIPALVFIAFWLLSIIKHQNDTHRLFSYTLKFYLFLIIFLSPLIIYFIFNPADFVARAGTVSIFNPDWNQGDFWGTVWHTLALTLGTFVGLTGDTNPLVNLPGQPALVWVLVPFFLLGLGITIYRVFRSPSPLSPFSSLASLFLLIWWLVMLLPAILAPEGAPHHLRLIGTLVPTLILVAIGLVISTTKLAQYLRATHLAPQLSYLLPAICYLLLLINTVNNYFIRWPQSGDFTLTFDRYAVQLADEIVHAPADVAYVIPMDIRAGNEARHYTLDYLLAHLDPLPYVYLPVDEINAETVLDQAASNTDEIRIVRWIQDKHNQADAKEIISYLLATNAQLVERTSFPVYNVETYRATNQSNFELPPINQPINVTFADVLRIDAAYLPQTTISGDWLPVALTLSPLAQMDVDYKISLRLIDPSGKRVAQKDRVLLHTYHQGTSLWPSETVNEYYLLPIPPDIAPGEYTVSVVIYHPDSQDPLTAAGQPEISLGTVRVE